MADKIKLLIAALVLVAAMVAFYVMSEVELLFRVLGLLVALAVSVFIASTSEQGSATIAFARGSITEIRKVIWPTRKETTHTTIMVMVMVIIVGIILWIFDWFLAWGVKLLTGQGG
jgi:preprotein translocase subunit SecE